jgi:pimeloyl-ACP methyl ester carboxylesterase
VTILRGALSDLFTADVADRMVASWANDAELVTVPDVGHAPSFDEPESIAAGAPAGADLNTSVIASVAKQSRAGQRLLRLARINEES